MLIALLDTAKKLQIYKKNWVLCMIVSALLSHNLIKTKIHKNKR